MRTPALSIVLLSLASACAAETTRSVPEAASVTVAVVRTVREAPPAGDGPSVVELTIERDGARRTFARTIGAVALADAALVLGEDRTLWRAELDASLDARLDDHVDFVPVVAPRAGTYAYARSDDDVAHTLIVRDERGARVVAEGLASIGALRFVDAALVFVGARPGGVAGLWVAHLEDGARAVCATNCALRTGSPWGDAFEPPPTDLGSLELVATELRWSGPSGEPRRATVPAP